MTSDIGPFEISNVGSEADAFAAEILTMSYPLNVQAMETYWRIPLYLFPAPDPHNAMMRHDFGAQIRAVFAQGERSVLSRIYHGNAPLAPDVRLNETTTARELAYPSGSKAPYEFSDAIALVWSPARLVTSTDKALAHEALRYTGTDAELAELERVASILLGKEKRGTNAR